MFNGKKLCLAPEKMKDDFLKESIFRMSHIETKMFNKSETMQVYRLPLDSQDLDEKSSLRRNLQIGLILPFERVLKKKQPNNILKAEVKRKNYNCFNFFFINFLINLGFFILFLIY